MACASGKTNDAGDDASGEDTVCRDSKGLSVAVIVVIVLVAIGVFSGIGYVVLRSQSKGAEVSPSTTGP